MNIQKIKVTALLAAAGMALCTSAVKADALTYNDGDLLLGFYAAGGTGVTKDIVVNLGAAATFRDATGAISLNLGNLGTDLTAAFGSDWNTRADLYWGVFGAVRDVATPVNGDGDWTLYAGKAEVAIGTQGIGFNRGSAGTQSVKANDIFSAGSAYATYTSTANSNVAALQNTADVNSYATFQTNGGLTSFGFQNAQGNFGSGTSGTALDLFRMATGSSSLKGTYEGTFHISNTGSVNFTTTPVPEPGTIFMGIALVGFIAWRERRRLASLLKLAQQS